MLKVTSVIFFITVNISQINVFQIDGLFSSAHLDSLENHFVQNTYSQEDLFVIQYSADDHTKGTIDKFNFMKDTNPNLYIVYVFFIRKK